MRSVLQYTLRAMEHWNRANVYWVRQQLYDVYTSALFYKSNANGYMLKSERRKNLIHVAYNEPYRILILRYSMYEWQSWSDYTQ